MLRNLTVSNLTRETAIDLLINAPYLFGQAVGFTLLTELHNGWIQEMVFGEDDETLQAHRGSYKTTAVSIALACIIILYLNDKTLFMRKSDDDVKEIIEQVKKILEHPVTKLIVRVIYGVELRLVKSSSTELTTNLTNDPRGTSQLVGKGSKGSLTGKHFDRIFTDDIVNIQDRISKAERERTKTVYQELQNIKNRGGRIFNTGTPWHAEDCFCLMPNPKKYDCYQTGLIAEEELQLLKSRMLASLFAANYELKHIAAEDVIFTDPVIGGDPALVEQARFVHVDAAYVDNSDYTAMTICRKVGEKYYVYGRLWHKAVDSVKYEMIAERKRFNTGGFLCESNADKGMLAKMLKMEGERASTYHEEENKYIKIVTFLKWVWQDVVFVTGTDEEYIKQICDYNEFAEHDDAPDSLASYIRKLYGKTPDYQAIWN